MSQTLDVYRDWLGIKETRRPLNHYQLLRLKPFEDDPAKIREHYRKLNAHVRKYAAGDYAQQSQELLNELAQAMLCLTDERRKAEYDARLGRTTDRQARGSLEEILARRGLATPEQLQKAQRYAEAVGLELRDALVQQKVAPAEVIMQCYAESIGLPYVDLDEMQLDGALVVSLPAVLCRKHSLVAVLRDADRVIVVSPHPINPEIEDELRLRLEANVQGALCTATALHAVIEKHYGRGVAEAEMRDGRHLVMGSGAAAGKVKRAASSKPKANKSPEELAQTRKAVALFAGAMTLVGCNLFLGGMLGLVLGVVGAAAIGGGVYALMKAAGR